MVRCDPKMQAFSMSVEQLPNAVLPPTSFSIPQKMLNCLQGHSAENRSYKQFPNQVGSDLLHHGWDSIQKSAPSKDLNAKNEQA